MESLLRFFAIVQADLRERTRSLRFWVVLAGTIAATWMCFPPLQARYLVLSLEDAERGFYSSAWAGMVLAMVYSSLLSLVGFYLVRGTLVRDIETRVWQLLVATPMTRRGFLLAKWTSHMAVFAVQLGVGLLVALLAQWVRAEDRAIDLIELVKPALWLSVPSLAMTAMFAVWFDLVPWLRRTAGNVLFFFMWTTLLALPLATLSAGKDAALRTSWLSDSNGIALVARDFHRVRERQTGEPQEFGLSIGRGVLKKQTTRFEWRAWQPRPMDLLGRALWLLLALGGVALAAPLLDWAAARGASRTSARNTAGRQLRWLDWLLRPFARHPLGLLVAAELRLVLRQRRLVWWLLALVLLGVQSFGSVEGIVNAMLLAWLLPLDILARSVLRESDNRTGGLVFAAPGILHRLLAARFVVGFLIALALTLPGVWRLSCLDSLAALTALVVCASIASWGLALGALCRNPRPFELLMVALVYLGLQGASVFDLLHSPQQTLAWHGLLLLPAWLSLSWAWPHLARR